MEKGNLKSRVTAHILIKNDIIYKICAKMSCRYFIKYLKYWISMTSIYTSNIFKSTIRFISCGLTDRPTIIVERIYIQKQLYDKDN